MSSVLDILDLTLPQVMGIVNLAPESFTATGRCLTKESVLQHVAEIVEAGAAIIDVGGEPTHPGTNIIVSLQQELDRVVPIVELLRNEFAIPISVDTSQPEVMRAAVAAGASMINDVRALRYEGALEAVADLDVPVCVMHMQYIDGKTRETNPDPYRGDVLSYVKNFLQERITVCLNAGIAEDNIIIDPGIGGGRFGKNTRENLQLLHCLKELKSLNRPILVGVSRKIFLGDLLNKPASERMAGSISANVWAVYQGANILRVHDVKETVDAVKVITSIMNRG